MYRRSLMMSNFDKNTFLTSAIVLTWVAGLFLGICADRFHGKALRACFLLTPYQIPDFFRMVCIQLLPLLISAYAVTFFKPLLLGACLGRAFLTGAGISAIASLYTSAALLVSTFLLFSLLFFGPVLIWYWIYAAKNGLRFWKCTGICFGIGLLLSWVDHWAVAPLLWEIINF